MLAELALPQLMPVQSGVSNGRIEIRTEGVDEALEDFLSY